MVTGKGPSKMCNFILKKDIWKTLNYRGDQAVHSSCVKILDIGRTGTYHTQQSRASQTCLMGDFSWMHLGHARTEMFSASRNCVLVFVAWACQKASGWAFLSLWQFVQKHFHYRNQLLHELSWRLVSCQVAKLNVVICAYEASCMYSQILWEHIGDVFMGVK